MVWMTAILLTCWDPPGSTAWREALQAQPQAPLDARVPADKVTTLAPPTVPPDLTPPPPVIRRVAEAAADVPVEPACFDAARQAIDRGLAFLRASQGPGGGWMEGVAAQGSESPQVSPAASAAVTGLVIRAFAQAGMTADPAVRRGTERLLTLIKPGGTLDPDPSGGLGSYVASCGVLALLLLQRSAVSGYAAKS